MLDWSIIDEPNCHSAKKNRTEYACRSNRSICYDDQSGADIGIGVTNIVGYICQCELGYTGNPYVQDGCTTDQGTSFYFQIFIQDIPNVIGSD